MTLLITVATEDRVVQASDRRLTLPDGSVYTDGANKALVVHCSSSRFAIASDQKRPSVLGDLNVHELGNKCSVMTA